MTSELPADKPRHLLGISEPDDLFAAVEAGADAVKFQLRDMDALYRQSGAATAGDPGSGPQYRSGEPARSDRYAAVAAGGADSVEPEHPLADAGNYAER